ncbi:ammonium transporter 1 [Aspergillus lentulus]|uniref:Ammonium transporter n=1 Tax=Aspergillus lentulus TaxID=293939 RepID=A0ABQ0ZUR0_ASPLE|nr:ammonium transporter 1 [Aspergillus lentulus]GFF38126.1 ammonium transporter 1 [Aspergillus lentulus]GFF46157.1 ammonium transporter 1 [Aspergillus lentulus]GFF63870.1 ammonium transporter 1 [Aspergillus lentulus]GFF65379.1 ammonium transporter 1 [Aspergillus lentulus]GFG01494.1 ammonium transporter 1 [Aspergillus lentulus]
MSDPVYNASTPEGGDPTKLDVNAQYAGFEYHYVYIMTCSFVVWLILPGIGLLYSGLARRKSALALLFQSWMILAVTTFQWMFWGYSLTYSRDGGPFIGTLKNFGMRDVLVAPSPGSAVLPEIVFCLYQLLFCACTVMIVVGGAVERGNVLPSLIFSFFWATLVYCPVARWTWSSHGWLYNLPALDFAGGGPVHIASGWAALAYAMVLGKRKDPGMVSLRKPHNTTLVFIGTVLICFGWLGFNGGSTLNASVRSMVVIFNTNTAASTGILGWAMVDYIKHKRKFSVVGACEGAIAGLVGITPAAGYVSVWLAACIGFITSIVCSLLQNINDWLNIDEGMDVFKLHGVGGIVGAFLTGLFATENISSLDGLTFSSGAIDGNGIQVGYQLAEICAISGYSFVVSCVLLYILKFIPGLNLRVDEESEIIGLDQAQLFDEQIGDWSLVDNSTTVTTPTIIGVSKRSSVSKDETLAGKAM